MATRSVLYTTKCELPCGCQRNAPVILCISPSLTVTGKSWIDATSTPSSTNLSNCGDVESSYIFSYDDSQLNPVDDLIPVLKSSSITGVICRNCLTKYIDENISLITCIESTETVTLSISEEGCLSAVAEGGGGGGCDCFQPLYLNPSSNASALCDDQTLASYDIPIGTFVDFGPRVDFTITGTIAAINVDVSDNPHDYDVTVYITVNGDNVASLNVNGTIAHPGGGDAVLIPFSLKGSITRQCDVGLSLLVDTTAFIQTGSPSSNLTFAGSAQVGADPTPFELHSDNNSDCPFVNAAVQTLVVRLDKIGMPLSVAAC